MKAQDIVFIFVTIVLMALRQPRMFVRVALASTAVSVPLFAFWVFFTAQRLVLYAAAWLALYCIYMLLTQRENGRRVTV